MKKQDDIAKKLKVVFAYDHFNQDKAWKKVESRIFDKPTRNLFSTFLRQAAIFLATLVSGAILYHFVSTIDQETVYSEIKVPLGQMSEVTLPDGSNIWLNSGSSIKYSNEFAKGNRDIYLDGEAFFEVTPNKSSPFSLKTKNLEILVTGTSFNVFAYGNEKQHSIALVDGKVNLLSSTGKKIKELKQGQLATYTEGDNTIVLSRFDKEFYTSWVDGTIVFKMEKLEDIVPKLERWYNINIQIEEPAVKEFRFTGKILKNKPVEQIFKALQVMEPELNYQFIVNPVGKDLVKIGLKN